LYAPSIRERNSRDVWHEDLELEPIASRTLAKAFVDDEPASVSNGEARIVETAPDQTHALRWRTLEDDMTTVRQLDRVERADLKGCLHRKRCQQDHACYQKSRCIVHGFNLPEGFERSALWSM
jgi:hypothetical protein